MSDQTFVQGDTAPPVTGALKNLDGTPADLTNVDEARFQMRKPDDRRYTVDAIADIVGAPTNGNVKYDWAADDLDVPGEYIAQWELTYVDGRIQTTHPANTITIRRQ
jgi:hypothetical protein